MSILKSLSSKLGISVLLLALTVGVGFGFAKAYTGPAPAVVVEGDYIAAPETKGPDDLVVGGDVENNNPDFSEGLGIQGVDQFVESGTIELGEYQASFQNKSSNVMFLETAYAYVNGTASTTLVLDVATSTDETIAFNTNPFSSIIDSYQISTSTRNRTINNHEDQGTNGQQMVAVQPSEWVIFYVDDPYYPGNCTGSVCENATSTNRGYTLDWKAKGSYNPTR